MNYKALLRPAFTILFLLLIVNCFCKDLYRVNTERLNVRGKAGSSNSSLGYLKYNDVVEVIDKSNSEWFRIEVKGINGYVKSEYLIPTAVKREEINKYPLDNAKKILFWALIIVVIICSAILLIGRTKVDNPPYSHNPTIILKPKSVIGAIVLTLLFGPFGMFYSTIKGALVMLFLPVLTLLIVIGLYYTDLSITGIFIIANIIFYFIFYWFICVMWAAIAASQSNRIPLNLIKQIE